MVEVFKTNVIDPMDANRLVFEIGTNFSGCVANFDLEDCDRILRIKHPITVDPVSLIALLGKFGYQAEILADEIPC